MKTRLSLLGIVVVCLALLCACGSAAAPAPQETAASTPRPAADVGIGVWGDTPETVEALCEHGEWAYTRTASSFAGYETILEYYFNDSGLYAGEHRLMGEQAREAKYADAMAALTEPYGPPSAEMFSTADHRTGLASFEEALEQNGWVEAYWRIPDGETSRSSVILSMLPDGSVTVRISTLQP